MTFDDIRKANESIKTTDIKGKDYAEVNQRVKAFRMVYPEGAIHTELVSLENGVCVFKAMVYANGDGTVNSLLATGHAYEKENSNYINKTSYIENCETSAIGRALGFCGFGIDTSIASYEEVANAKLNQDEIDRSFYISAIHASISNKGLDEEKVCKKAKTPSIEDTGTDRLPGMLKWLNELDEAKRKELM